MSIKDLGDVNRVLVDNGYNTKLKDDFLAVDIDGFTTVLTINEDMLNINCHLFETSALKSLDTLGELSIGLLNYNTEITPFAFGTNVDSDKESEWDVLLTDSLATHDLSEEELLTNVGQLEHALVVSSDFVQDFLKREGV